jgi:hypothetical protein
MSTRLGPTSRDMIAVVESVAVVPTRTAVHETASVLGPDSGGSGRVLVQLIKAGWSLNGSYWSANVLRSKGPTAWPAGTLNYVDHFTADEDEARPAGSLMRLASYQTTDARWDEQRQALVAEVRVFSKWREQVAEWTESGAIGMSIRAWVLGAHGEAEGRSGFIVEDIEGRSCDYVTEPAAGGALLAVLESVRRPVVEARNIGAWLESRLHMSLTQLADEMYGDGRLTRDERIVLSSAIGDGLAAWVARVDQGAPQLWTRDVWDYPEPAASATEEARRVAEATVEERRSQLHDEISEMWGDDQTYTWVRDFDLDKMLVWFDCCPADSDSTTWQQSYTVADDGDVELTGDRIEVVARTVYDPAEPEDEPEVIDGTTTEALATPVLQAAQAVTESVTDGAPSTVTDPPTEEESAVAETQAGAAPPVQAGTAPVATAPPTTPTAEGVAASTAVLEAMQALTRQVTALTESNATLVERANARDTEDRTQRNRQAAREAVAAALAAPEVPADLREQIGPRVTLAILADVPTTDAGDLDATALGEAITTSIAAESGYAARLLESAGVGRPRGLGSQAPQQQSADEFEKSMAKKFEALGHSPEFAAIAGRGRG